MVRIEDYTEDDPSPKILDLFRHVTNGAECLSFAIFFSLFIVIMIWQMQIFRRVFRLKENTSIVDPKKVVHVHLLILIYLIIKITSYAYALISGQIDYRRKKHLQEKESLGIAYFNPIIYALLLNLSAFSQVSAYILTIKNWLSIRDGFVDGQHKLPCFINNLTFPILITTFFFQVTFMVCLFLEEHYYIYIVAQIITVFYILLISFISISSYTIYKFFKSAYTQSQYLTRAIIFVNVGLLIQAIKYLLNVTCPVMIINLKHYNNVTKIDDTVNWAYIWSFEQLFGSIIPTIFIITLVRPVLFLFPRTQSQQNSLFQSMKPSLKSDSQSKKSHSKQSLKSHSMNDDLSFQKQQTYITKVSESFTSSQYDN